MLSEQESACAICFKNQSDLPLRLAVDHDHKTGKIRALLCHSCNARLGVLESKVFVRAATAYLLKFSGVLNVR